MKNQFLEEAQRELVNGHSKRKHPFRYFTLATIENGLPRQRTVVLRKTLQDMSLVFFTDSRTQKIKDLENNPEFSALFYNPKQLLQLRLQGRAEVITDKTEIETYWHTVQAASRKDYTTHMAPSTTINNPDDVAYNSETNYFCPIKLVPNSVEYLRLKRPNHLRILFSKATTGWDGQFIVP